jgi:ADP-ribose pyrophosphatase YjhB (NUDIX family)
MKKIIPEASILIPDEVECVFRGIIFDVYQWSQKLFDGSEQTFEMLKRSDTVTAICITDSQHIIVIDDEQPHLGSRKSFPGGRVDDVDETIEAAAEREILEETGYSFKNWRLIKVAQPQKKIEWFVYLFLAWEETGQTLPNLDAGEKIENHTLPYEEVKQMIMKKEGYLGEVADIFENTETVEDLLSLNKYNGLTVTR